MSGCGHPVEALRVRANGVRECRVCRNRHLKRARARRLACGDGGRVLVYATRSALDQAAALLPTGSPCLETLTERALAAGLLRRRGFEEATAPLAAGLAVTLRRSRSPLTGRAAWTVTELTTNEGAER